MKEIDLQAILFDFDGTVVESERVYEDIFKNGCGRNTSPLLCRINQCCHCTGVNLGGLFSSSDECDQEKICCDQST